MLLILIIVFGFNVLVYDMMYGLWLMVFMEFVWCNGVCVWDGLGMLVE